MDRIQAEPACQNESTLRSAWLDGYEKAKPCWLPASNERNIREAEYVAACLKCGIKERCDQNLSHNMSPLLDALFRSGNPDFTLPVMDETGLVFACDRR